MKTAATSNKMNKTMQPNVYNVHVSFAYVNEHVIRILSTGMCMRIHNAALAALVDISHSPS